MSWVLNCLTCVHSRGALIVEGRTRTTGAACCSIQFLRVPITWFGGVVLCRMMNGLIQAMALASVSALLLNLLKQEW